MCLWKYIKNAMREHPKKTIIENDNERTYLQVISAVENLACRLKGIKCCAIDCSSEMNAGIAILACIAANVTALPLSRRYGLIHCEKILNSICPDAIIKDDLDMLKLEYRTDCSYKQPNIKPAFIMCTSGTSGKPKGVMLTEKNVLTNVNDIISYFDIGVEDRILISRPLYHSAVLTGEFITSLIKGVDICFCSTPFDPMHILRLMKTQKITVFGGTPTIMNTLAHFRRKDDKLYLKRICVSGECMGAETGKQIRKAFPEADIYHVYGLTEASPRVSYLPPELFDKYCDCVGVPLPSVSVKIISADGKNTKENQEGVLWVKGNNVMSGYYNEPNKTDEVMKDGWLCTGDMAFINEHGLLKIKGRADDMLIRAGMNIYPQEIENALKTDKRVKEVCAFGEKNSALGTQIILNIVGNFENVSEVKKLCISKLPAYQMPSKINIVEKIEKNGSGKIIRRKNYD